MEALRQVFHDFTSFGAGQAGSSEMDSAKFVKFAKDCKLVGKKLSTTDLDLIFTKVKDKTAKKINFDTFVEAVNLIAQKMNKSPDDIINIIVSAKGPSTGAATVADNVKFHDDKSTFTGVHTQGGPSQIDHHNVDMANQLNRSEGADVRGVKDHQGPSPAAGAAAPRRASKEEAARRASHEKKTSAQKKAPTRPSESRKSASSPRDSSSAAAAGGGGGGGNAAVDGGADGGAAGLEERVKENFITFASSVAKASGEMDSMKFFKLMGDCSLTGKSLSRTDCDLIFTKTCSTSGCVKKIHYDAFRKVAISLLAAHLKLDEDAVLAKVGAVKGVSSSGTVAQASRFHDDKTTYTGAHAAGGPTNVDQRVSLEGLANRSSADVRGVQASVYKLDPKAAVAEEGGTRRSSGSIACGAAVVSPMITKTDTAAARSAPKRNSKGSAGSAGSVGSGDPERRTSSLAEAGGVIAGSANKKGGVYDRLSG